MRLLSPTFSEVLQLFIVSGFNFATTYVDGLEPLFTHRTLTVTLERNP